MPMRTTVDEPPSMNVIPMIDILFNLIIFLVVGTEFAQSEANLPLQVPEVVSRQDALTRAPAPRVVNVYSDGSIALDSEPVKRAADLTAQLAKVVRQYSDLKVLVRGDARVPHGRMAEVYNACKQAGVRDLGIAVRTVAEEPPEAKK